MENEFPTACCGVNVFSQTLKPDVPAVQISDPLNEVFEGSAKSVKPPDDEGIPVSNEVKASASPFRSDFMPLMVSV
jgi:hypothetical protein